MEGPFLLAVFAAIAYINSTEKPRLVVRSSYTLQFEPWVLSLRFEDRGPVAARFVAVKLKFVEATIDLPYEIFPMAPWTTGAAGWTQASEAFWKGGANAVIHPRWEYQAPPFKCNITARQTGQPAVDIEVVADDVPSFVTRYPLMEQK